MTEKRFSHKKWYNERQLFDGDEPFAIVDVYIQAEVICDKLNELHEEKEKWKCNCLEAESENSILWNEVLILRKQGALPSNAFEKYLDNLKNKNKLKVVLHG